MHSNAKRSRQGFQGSWIVYLALLEWRLWLLTSSSPAHLYGVGSVTKSTSNKRDVRDDDRWSGLSGMGGGLQAQAIYTAIRVWCKFTCQRPTDLLIQGNRFGQSKVGVWLRISVLCQLRAFGLRRDDLVSFTVRVGRRYRIQAGNKVGPGWMDFC
jgi:hypothetical protein